MQKEVIASITISFDLYEKSKLFPSMRKYAEPTPEGLYFVGVHTQNDSGYLKSAVRSGKEAANIILVKTR